MLVTVLSALSGAERCSRFCDARYMVEVVEITGYGSVPDTATCGVGRTYHVGCGNIPAHLGPGLVERVSSMVLQALMLASKGPPVSARIAAGDGVLPVTAFEVDEKLLDDRLSGLLARAMEALPSDDAPGGPAPSKTYIQ